MGRTESVVFMNMCMLEDDSGRVLALDKVSPSYSGITFPGGHVEPGETFKDSMIREFYEETGLTIKDPVLRGIYHWSDGDVRNVGLMYLAREYSGELRASDEGRVFWVPASEYPELSLADGMPEVWRMMHEDSVQEVMQVRTPEGYISLIP